MDSTSAADEKAASQRPTILNLTTKDEAEPIVVSPVASNHNDDSADEDTIHAFNVSNVTVIEIGDGETAPRPTEEDRFSLDNVSEVYKAAVTTNNDGSDSGVELCGGPDGAPINVFQRAFSSNSGGYASSCGGMEDCPMVLSCDSSLISCCSNDEDAYEILSSKTSTLLGDLSRAGDRTSENGSESSSVTGSLCGRIPKSSLSVRRVPSTGLAKKKVALAEPIRQTRARTAGAESPAPRSRSKTNTTKIIPPKIPFTSTTRARSREKFNNTTPAKPSPVTAGKAPVKSAIAPTIHKVPVTKRDLSISKVSSASKSTNVKGRPATAASPTDDGRWPSTGVKTTTGSMTRSVRGNSVTSETIPLKSRQNSVNPVESKATAIEKYATLPRRRREKTPESAISKDTRNHFVSRSRDASLTRSPVLKKQNSKDQEHTKYLPPYPIKKKPSKIKIYHEVSVQTALTLHDVEEAMIGNITKVVNIEDVERVNCGVQVDRTHELVDKLETQLKELSEKYTMVLAQSRNQSQQLIETQQLLKIEREEKLAVKDELERNTQRVLAMLYNTHEVSNSGGDSLLVLESQFQRAGEIVVKQEQEISELHALCRNLQRDLDASVQTQRTLRQQQHDIEAESSELQEFIQAEKSTLAEVLRDTEEDVRTYRHKLKQKDTEVQRQQDECKHLVRISEQRRQENLMLQARIGGLEARSRELLLQQGAAVSGAAVALSGLSSRLEGLVTQLIITYNISEQDLEDVIYHNEAYSNSESSEGDSLEKSEVIHRTTDQYDQTPSPKRGASFVSAVISAIKNAAATTAFTATHRTHPNNTADKQQLSDSDTSDSADLLDSETEPVLMMENVLEDVTLPDTHSHNMVSSTHSLMNASRLGHSESLHNLSQAILNRQEHERSLQASTDQMSTSLSEYCPALTLVDQIIDVDNLVTKLLKVLRIIQIENDAYCDELQEERSQQAEQIQKQKEACAAAVKQLKDWEKLGARLKSQLAETAKQLVVKKKELEDTKRDLTEQRNEVERLNEDICKLSQICSQAERKQQSREEEANATLKQWQETGKLPTSDVLARLVTARHEIPSLKEQLQQKEKELTEVTEKFSASHHVMTESWSQAINETRRQYEAIDAALETLIGIQNVVEKCPPLAKLQQNLEETGFQSASTIPIPIVASDFNANANHQLDTSSGTAINGTA